MMFKFILCAPHACGVIQIKLLRQLSSFLKCTFTCSPFPRIKTKSFFSSSPMLVAEIQIIQERHSHLCWMCSHLKYSKYPWLPTQKQINMYPWLPTQKYAKHAKYPWLSTQKLCNQNCNSFHRRNLPIPFNISSSKQSNGACIYY